METNKKYIDDVLKKNPDFVFYDYDNECVGDDLIKLIKEVEKKSYEKGFIDGSELTGRIAEETKDKKVEEIRGEIEKEITNSSDINKKVQDILNLKSLKTKE